LRNYVETASIKEGFPWKGCGVFLNSGGRCRRGSYDVGVGGWRHFGWSSVVVGGWKTTTVVFVEVSVIHFFWFPRIVKTVEV